MKRGKLRSWACLWSPRWERRRFGLPGRERGVVSAASSLLLHLSKPLEISIQSFPSCLSFTFDPIDHSIRHNRKDPLLTPKPHKQMTATKTTSTPAHATTTSQQMSNQNPHYSLEDPDRDWRRFSRKRSLPMIPQSSKWQALRTS